MSYSRQIVSVVTAVLLAVHLLVGCCCCCCAGHAHDDAHAKPQAADDAGHRCADHSQVPSGPLEHGPCDQSGCHCSCVFVASSRIVLPELSQLTVALACGDLLELSSAAPVSFGGDRFYERPCLPHLRSHLSKRVLIV